MLTMKKGANETVEVTIKGLFSGKNQAPLTYAQELYEDTLISDLDTAAKLYGNTVQTATYEDATFFAKGDQDLDALIEKKSKHSILTGTSMTWLRALPTTQPCKKSISSMFQVADYLFIGSLIFASLLLTLLLVLWLNARRREVGILLALGLSKVQIAGQFVAELVMISIPAFLLSYGVAGLLAKAVGDTVLKNVTSGIAKQMAQESSAANLGGGS